MDETDLLVIAAHDLPIDQWRDMVIWWVYPDFNLIMHPSIKWTIEQRAYELAAFILNLGGNP